MCSHEPPAVSLRPCLKTEWKLPPGPLFPRPTLTQSFPERKTGLRIKVGVKPTQLRLSQLPRPAEAAGVSSHTDPTREEQASSKERPGPSKKAFQFFACEPHPGKGGERGGGGHLEHALEQARTAFGLCT